MFPAVASQKWIKEEHLLSMCIQYTPYRWMSLGCNPHVQKACNLVSCVCVCVRARARTHVCICACVNQSESS